MTRPMTLPNGLWGVMVVLCAITACGRADDRPGADTPRGGDEPLAFLECDTARVVSEALRAEIVSWARGLTYHDVDTTRAYIRGASSTASPSIHAAGDARRRPRAVLQQGCIIGRIVSTAANASLGIAAGTNYIWADSGSSGWRVTIIPEAGGAGLRSYDMRIHEHAAGSSERVALSSIEGPCVECELAGWCRWPTDTTQITR